MQAAFLQALRSRVGYGRPCSQYTLLPVGQVLTTELTRALSALEQATKENVVD